jgi:retinol dehydrogenase 12
VFELLRTEEDMNQDRYNMSKLLQLLLGRQLAEEMGPPGPVILNVNNPGLCKTTLFRHMPVILGWIMAAILFVLARTAEMGSRTIVAAAFGGEDTHGEYTDSCEVYPPSKYVLSPEGQKMQKKLLGDMLDILEDVQPDISKNIKG